ncbi:MAG: DTW domain-containing protein [Nannocystis sp.]|nr:DTW domain-containing protein [Nannocystis sp.]
MGQRARRLPRCPGCGLHSELCLCAEAPTLALSTRFIFVQHRRERDKPTNSARLAHKVLGGSELIHYGERDQAMETAPLTRPERDYVLLFPQEHARELTPADGIAAPGREIAVVVLDGTWHQCSRMARRAPGVDALPCYALPPGAPSRWGIRTPPRPGALCTYEAVTRVVGLFHGDAAAAQMAAFFAAVTERQWQMRGGRREPAVEAEAEDALTE